MKKIIFGALVIIIIIIVGVAVIRSLMRLPAPGEEVSHGEIPPYGETTPFSQEKLPALDFSSFPITAYEYDDETAPALTVSTSGFLGLGEGDSGPNVFVLQQILNQDPDTQIASTGSGSPGNETNYFGAATTEAVKKLQEKYASDIPEPTGAIDPYTDALLAILAQLKAGSTAPPPASAPVTAPPSSFGAPVINSIDPDVITKAVEDVTITGSNFTSTGNAIVTSGAPLDAYIDVSSESGTEIRFQFHFTAADILKESILAGASVAEIDYEDAAQIFITQLQVSSGSTEGKIPIKLRVENSNGTSNEETIEVDIISVLMDPSKYFGN